MDINISSQIVVQTSAQWAADNTVYSAKRILVTSDVYYGSTDQRKFKIADGVQTWSNLDYMPIEQVTTSTIGSAINGATSATPNDTDLVMSVDTSVAKKNTWTQIKAFLKTYFDTVYQAAGTYLTSANITQTITNGVTDKAPSEDTVFDALALKANLTDSRFVIRTSDTTRYTNTGSTTENVITSLLISAGTYTNKLFEVYIKTITSTGSNNKTFRIYFNTSADLTGSPVLAATYTATTAGGNFTRKFKDLGTTIKNYVATTTSFASFEQAATSTSTENTLSVDLTTAKYVVITAQNQISGESAIVDFCYTQNIT